MPWGWMNKLLKRTATSTIIRMGPGNPIVRLLIERKCREFGVVATLHAEYLSLRKGEREMRLARRHFVYAADMAERFDLYTSPLLATEIDGVQVLDYSRPGILQTYARSGLQFELASFPEEDEAIDSYFEWYKPRDGDTIFDAGAHCGVSTYHFSKVVGETGRVVCFEPDPVNYGLLLRNIERHDLRNVVPLQIAIAGTTGEAAFNCEQSIGSGLARHSTRSTVGTVAMVRTVTLEEAFREWGPPQFCKIDIEGAEIEVISATQPFLRQTACHFALDTNHLVDGHFTDGRIEKLFKDCGYEAGSSTEGMKTTWARPASV
jgi:FkbM family methyltransferase